MIRSSAPKTGLLAAVSSAVLIVALLCASSAIAGKILGAPEWQNGGVEYFDGTLVQTSSPGNKYAAPADGVITSWGKWSSADPKKLQQLKLKVARESPGGWQIVAESNLETLTQVYAKNTFLTRLPVKLGDVIGLYGPGEQIMAWKESGYFAYGKFGEDALSSSAEFLQPTLNYLLVVYATWEPDLDGDGYGDESQDTCLNFPGISGCAQTVPATGPTKPGQTKLKCKKGFKKVKVKGKTKCKKVKSNKGKHKGKGKGKAKGHK
ncbi:MAG: hypothetical protein WD827_01860 [Solirubrobacterales bacterium]